MIALHRPDGTPFFLQVAHIVVIETTPDTVITLYSGNKIRVREDGRTVCDTINAWFQRFGSPAVVTLPPPLGGHAPDEDKDA